MKKLFYVIPIITLAFFLFTAQSDNNKVSMNQIDGPRLPVYIPGSPAGIVPVQHDVPMNSVTRYLMSPAGVFAVASSYRPFPTTATQSECEAYSNPNVPGKLIVGWNSYYPSFYGTGFAMTTNGGNNWTGNNTLPGIGTNSGDPSEAINSSGYIFMNAIGTGSGAANMTSRSTDNGVTWGPYVTTFLTTYMADKNHITIDDKATSPYYNNLYVGFSDFGVSSTATPIRFCKSTDGGVTYSNAIVTGPMSGYFSQGVNINTGPNGEVYMIYCTGQQGSPYTGRYVGFGKSTNGGANWIQVENKIPISGIRGTLKTTGIRCNDFPWMAVDKTGGPNNGNIYVAWNQKNQAPAGTDPDICFSKSTDGGSNFSAPIRINDDPINNGRDQWMPSICVDQYGGVNIIFYDSRNGSINDTTEAYVARSIDGGNTFTNILVSDHRFKPKPISGLAGGYQGDYIGIASVGNKVFPFWADDYTGAYQVWTAPIDLGPAIDHTPLTNTEQTTGTRTVNCIITPAGQPIVASLTKLFVAKNSTNFSDSTLLTNSGGNNWQGTITLSGPATYRYYIRTVDNTNRIAFAPGNAPAGYYSFQAMPDTVKPVITHTPLLDCPKLAWPSTVTASVTDNIGLDSVWVNWKKNYNGTQKRFKLLHTTGSTYQAAFNSTQAEVNYNDTIFYKVIAQDISSNHNRDSTSQYNFKILSQTTACIGIGTVECTNYPFNTYWYGNRTQVLYLASEIMANQGSAGSISKIGFNVSTMPGQTMSGFNINLQNTTNTTISGFTTGGWTNVYSGTYMPAGTGWQYVTLSTPYIWNGTSNLLVEICFGNTSFTTAGGVLGTTLAGMTYAEYHDISTACTTFLAPTSYATRPDACFVINTIVGVNNNTSTIPEIYTLNQNYPNPFNPVTQIKYGIPKQGLVTMKVYDVLGREITKLVNEVKTPGSYIVDFDGSNLSSGVYFYKLESNGFIDVKKMMLIK
jgi:hypothetical protein